MYLDKINKTNDIKQFNIDELNELSKEIRKFLVKNISQTGGHLASNLGAVELTLALHHILDFPKDKLIFDVGHQAYIHKILTGRKDEFKNLRKTRGLSGFPNPNENENDLFRGGHASTSIGEGVGLCEARRIQGTDERIAVVIGDGALTGGIAFEALNNAALLKQNLTIVLNDNNMSITKNVGGVSANIASLRTSRAYVDMKEEVLSVLELIPDIGNKVADTIRTTKDGVKRLLLNNMFFEDLGITYLGPVDGHNLDMLIRILNQAFNFKGPVVVHAVTKKGRGYRPARENPAQFHGIAPFDIKTGQVKKKEKPDYTDVFSKSMKLLAKKDDRVCAVTAAMANGSGVSSYAKEFPDRFFDVGIAEEHAVILAAALAKSGLKPVVGIYSTFLQRSFDQVLMEVCLNNLGVVFAVDRAGLVGADGSTHQGVFDISYLSMMPGMNIMAPKNSQELCKMFEYATSLNQPVAIRYPKGEAYTGLSKFNGEIEYGKCEPIYEGDDVLLFALGSMVKTGEKVKKLLEKDGISVALTNARFAKPIDEEYLSKVTQKMIVTLEENMLIGGFGMMTESILVRLGYGGKIVKIAIPDKFISHGSLGDLYKICGLDAKSIAEKIKENL